MEAAEITVVAEFFTELRQLTVYGYYTSEAGATSEHALTNYMAPWNGDMPYADVGRMWSDGLPSSPRPLRSVRQSEHPLGQNIELHLRRAAFDGVGFGAQPAAGASSSHRESGPAPTQRWLPIMSASARSGFLFCSVP